MLSTYKLVVFLHLIPYTACLVADFERTNGIDLSPCTNGCGKNDAICECFLTIEHRLTMMFGNKLVYPTNALLFKYDDVYNPLNENEAKEVITADGFGSQLVIAINRQFPGPTITAYEDQQVIVHVRNLLHSDSFTLHWHGMKQKGTPHSDGTPFVSQCPILPGHTFTYNFTAKPHGTSFYHSHIANQRAIGLYGPLIIYKKDRDPSTELEEFIVTIQDWNHDDGPETIYQRMITNVFDIPNHQLREPTYSHDGGKYSNYWMHSGLINGKGRYYPIRYTINASPLYPFEVEDNTRYRFRVISASTMYPFRVYVEKHPIISIVASDGYDIVPMDVESFIIHPGERFDFILNTGAFQGTGNYLLVAESLEILDGKKGNEYHVAEAVIYHKSARLRQDNPLVGENTCSSVQPCIIFNCPFLYYPEGENKICKTFNDARSNDTASTPEDIIGTPTNLFFNFAFPGGSYGSVNGRQYTAPYYPALTDPDKITTSCNDSECGANKLCACTYSQSIENGNIYQFVLTNIGTGAGWSHPVHLHGHSFYVMKMGFGTYNQSSGELLSSSSDISCSDNYCNEKYWTHSSWSNGNVDGLILDKPVQKDTIIVPTGGYVVIRFKADNPGAWLLHCEINLHSMYGMGMVINESFTSYPAAPDNYKFCSTSTSSVTTLSPNLNSGQPQETFPLTCVVSMFWLVLVVNWTTVCGETH